MPLNPKTHRARPNDPVDERNPDRVGGPRSMLTHSTHFLDASQGGVLEDLAAGCAAGASITGPARTPTAGKDVVVVYSATGPGLLVVQDSEDGSTWIDRQSLQVIGGAEPFGARFAFASGQYRVRFTATTAGAVSRVSVFSQSRN